MITPIDVVDSAIKIGLGALISGLAAYWVAKTSHYKTLEKERAQRKRELLESVAQEFASHDHTIDRHLLMISNWLKFTPQDEKMSETEHAEFAKLEGEIFETRKELISAEAKLLLLGEINVYESFRGYFGAVMVFHQGDIASRKVTLASLQEIRKHLRQKREKFFKELSHVYTKN